MTVGGGEDQVLERENTLMAVELASIRGIRQGDTLLAVELTRTRY